MLVSVSDLGEVSATPVGRGAAEEPSTEHLPLASRRLDEQTFREASKDHHFYFGSACDKNEVR